MSQAVRLLVALTVGGDQYSMATPASNDEFFMACPAGGSRLLRLRKKIAFMGELLSVVNEDCEDDQEE